MGRLWVEASQCREATVEERPSRRRGVEASRPGLYIREHCPHRHPGIEASWLWRRGVEDWRIGSASSPGLRKSGLGGSTDGESLFNIHE